MSSITTENVFESAIVQSLIKQGGYQQATSEEFSRELALAKSQVISFLKDTQPRQWEKLKGIHRQF